MKGIMLFIITITLLFLAFQITAIREEVAPEKTYVEGKIISLLEDRNAEN